MKIVNDNGIHEMIEGNIAYQRWLDSVLANPELKLFKCNICSGVLCKKLSDLDDMECPMCGEDSLMPYMEEMCNN